MPIRTVLVVEDNPDGRNSLRMMLECWGYQVEVAEDGFEGMRKALTLFPDAVVSDIGLPELDGYEVARQIRAGLGDAVLLVALTGYTDVGQSLQAGFDVHLTKPVDPDVLASVLRGSRQGRRRSTVYG